MRLRHPVGHDLHRTVIVTHTEDGSVPTTIRPQSPDSMGCALAGSSRQMHLQSSATTDAASERPSQRGDASITKRAFVTICRSCWLIAPCTGRDSDATADDRSLGQTNDPLCAGNLWPEARIV
jgi:hypothetical protein